MQCFQVFHSLLLLYPTTQDAINLFIESIILYSFPIPRKLELETSIIQQCHGSARVRTVDGGTDILSSVKIEVMNTTEEAPNCGDIDVNVDFTASSSVHFRDREYELESIDLARKIKSYSLH